MRLEMKDNWKIERNWKTVDAEERIVNGGIFGSFNTFSIIRKSTPKYYDQTNFHATGESIHKKPAKSSPKFHAGLNAKRRRTMGSDAKSVLNLRSWCTELIRHIVDTNNQRLNYLVNIAAK